MLPKSSLLSLLCVAGVIGQAAAQTQYKCPDNKGDKFITNGKEYELLCDETFKGKPIEDKPCASVQECAERCATHPTCMHSTFRTKVSSCVLKDDGQLVPGAGLVTWKFLGNAVSGGNSAQQPIGQGSGNQQPIGQGAGSQQPIGQGAGSQQPVGQGAGNQQPIGQGAGNQQPIGQGAGNQQPVGQGVGNQASYQCGADHGKWYTSNDITYELSCDTQHESDDLSSQTVSSLEECAALCSLEPQCIGADYVQNTGVCKLKGKLLTIPWGPVTTKQACDMQCAQDPQCISSNFRPAANQCDVIRKVINSPWSDGHAWKPVQCPKVRETVINDKPEIATGLSCPTNNGKVFEGSDGTWFYLQCCTSADGVKILADKAVASHKDCLEECVADKQCKSYMFAVGAAPQGHSNCRLYTNGEFSTKQEEGMHYAFVTAPPSVDVTLSDAKRCSTGCPFADGQLYVTPTGENMLMSCEKRHGTTPLKVERRPSYEACMVACGAMPECLSVDYEPRTKKCYLGNNTKNPLIAAQAYLSAHSLGCSGACAGCKGGCDALDAELLPAIDTLSCPNDTGRAFSAGGEEFRLYCSHCYSSNGRTERTADAKTMEECATLCGEEPTCHGANWISGRCIFHAEIGTDGKRPSFTPDAQCDAFAPQHRSLPQPSP